MNAAWNGCARTLVWCIRRNPMYLLSAACMAVGARLYLVDPNSYAGDVGVILTTLGVLQAYEWAVTGILLLLRRARRAPEDESSLLLAAALFWTGPIAATIEMTARQPRLGVLLAIGVVIFAVFELVLVRRTLRLHLSVSGTVLSCACLLLLAVAPSQLRVVGAEGTNELLLYSCWWLLAGFALLMIPSLRTHFRGRADPTLQLAPLGREWVFLVIVLAATATHLVAMNYAFLGHARSFYAGPLLISLAVVGFEFVARGQRWPGPARFISGVLPLIALWLAQEPFDPEVPVRNLPVGLRDPLLTMLVLAALAWWFGALRTRSAGLFHLGSGGVALAACRAFVILRPAAPTAQPGLPVGMASARDIAFVVLAALFVYLAAVALLRRSRTEAMLALLVLQAVVATLVWQRVHADRFIMSVTAGWSLLVAIHLASRRASPAMLLIPVTILTLIAWVYDYDAALAWSARSNALVLFAVLLIVAVVSQRRSYWAIGLGQAAASVLFLGGRFIAAGQRPVAALTVLAAFVLLASGAALSWHKHALLAAALARQQSANEDAPTGSPGELSAET